MSITLNFTINIDSTMLRNLLTTARDIQITQTIDPAPPPPPSEDSEANSVVDSPAHTPGPVPLITNERKPVQWNKKTITLVSEDQIAQIANKIEMGELSSPSPIINWYTKHHPLKERALRIVTVLRNSPSRSLTFQSLLAQTGMPTKGNDALQHYLREMDKQGIIAYSPRD
jgi:hypothetical protein